MDAVKEFLLEYYVWVLAVLAILLITVIGFLADTKKKRRIREKIISEQAGNNNNQNNMENVNAEQSNSIENNVPAPDMNQEVNNMVETNPVMDNNINPNDSSFFVPASEQTPNIEPINVEMPTPMNNNVGIENNLEAAPMTFPQPIETIPNNINNSMPGFNEINSQMPNNNMLNNEFNNSQILNNNIPNNEINNMQMPNNNMLNNGMLNNAMPNNEVNNMNNDMFGIHVAPPEQVVNMNNLANQVITPIPNNQVMNNPAELNPMFGNQGFNVVAGPVAEPSPVMPEAPVINMDNNYNQGMAPMPNSLPTTSPIGINYQGASNMMNSGVVPIPQAEPQMQVSPIPAPAGPVNPMPLPVNPNEVNMNTTFANLANSGTENQQVGNNIMPGQIVNMNGMPPFGNGQFNQ